MEWLSCIFGHYVRHSEFRHSEYGRIAFPKPEAFNGTLYDFAKGLNSVFQATGLALVVLFFFIGLSDPSHNLAEIKRPEAIIAELCPLFALPAGGSKFLSDLAADLCNRYKSDLNSMECCDKRRWNAHHIC